MLPQELREVAQWLVSDSSKAPISPKTGHLADVRDSSLYVSYEEAAAYATAHGMDIGFALTADDPFTVIDLDPPKSEEQSKRHQQIFSAFDTYAELSRSGAGVHIWCRGTVPRGARRDSVEIYSSQRYMICTGRSVKDRPIADCQEMLDVLWHEVSRNGAGAMVTLEERDEVITDQEVFEMAVNATNGEKFEQLCRGEWQGDYPSQSEADYALMNILCFYTPSNAQAKRLFRYSALGKRDKAWREEYLDRMIAKIRAEEPPEIDLKSLMVIKTVDNGVRNTPVHVHESKKNSPHTVDSEGDFGYPPGFAGELARYIVESSTRPVKEVGISAALALCAGIVGRQFNISGTGLNQYIILLAKTGVGKEDGPRGIERLLKAVRPSVPMIDSFMGPGTFASGQAIIRTLDENPCFVSILGEFGLTLQDLSDENANSLNRVMRRVLLDLYGKSGKTSILYSSAYSDREKNTKSLFAPAMTLYGESTPDTFYAGLSLHHIADGLVPRFLIIEYTGDRPPRNPRAFTPPTEAMAQRVADLAEIVLRMTANQSWVDIDLDDGARALLVKFDKECDAHILGGNNEGVRQLWNRAHLKATRLAALLAAVDRPHDPVVNAEEAAWAIDLVSRDVEQMYGRFERGDVGEGDSKQVADMLRILRDYLERSGAELEKAYGIDPRMHSKGIVQYRFLSRRLIGLSAFRKDRRGATRAIKETISHLVDAGTLVEVPKKQLGELFNTRESAFYVRDV